MTKLKNMKQDKIESHSNLLVLNNHASSPLIKEDTIKAIIDFKDTATKSNPDRYQDIHGPFEELTLRKTGKLPPEYYEVGDDEPWGFRVPESRSNILWQVLSGSMDRHPEFATNYMALALDTALGDEDYIKELKGLNKSWGDYYYMSHVFGDHNHTSMAHTFARVACPACSMLASIACRDEGMQSVFKEMLPLKPADRKEFLSEKGLLGLLDVMVPEKPKQAKLIISD